ncbi:hypothetical protein AB0C77_31750 [Streptomyces sp. NPDC048629]|uniref:hypothetical protein n=1 Tax=Streptomyces sp. NPDC048629 TaxID=3154824 RepID=UPI00341F0662
MTTAVCAAALAAGVTGCSQFDQNIPDLGTGTGGQQGVRPAVAAPSPSPSPDPFKGMSADAIADKAVAATTSAKSLRMTGRVVSEGQPLAIDFSVNDKSECTGTLKVQGGLAQLRQIDSVAYMKGDERFWRTSMTSQGLPEPQIDATVELLKGRWVKIAAGQQGSSELAGVCDLKSLLADLKTDKDARTGLTRGKDSRVGAVPTATLVKKKADGERTTVSVAQRGKPYILRIVKTGGDEPGAIRLSAFDKPVKVVTPPADETVDLSRLEQGTGA